MQQLRETKDRPRVVRALEHAAAPCMLSLRSASPTSPTPRAVAAVFTAADLAGYLEADSAAFAARASDAAR